MENKWGERGRGGSGAERCSCAITPTRTAGAPGCCARHLWSTAGLAGSPASPTGLRAGLSEQWAGALRRRPLRQLSCTGVCPGLLNWEVEHAKTSGRRRQSSERSEQLRAKRAGRQNGTQTRAARATTRPGTDSPFYTVAAGF